MAELDEISVSIGSLQADVKNINSNLEHILNYFKESNSDLKELLTIHAEDDKKNFKDLGDRTKSLEKFQYKVYGIASLCTLIITGITNLASGYFKHNP